MDLYVPVESEYEAFNGIGPVAGTVKEQLKYPDVTLLVRHSSVPEVRFVKTTVPFVTLVPFEQLVATSRTLTRAQIVEPAVLVVTAVALLLVEDELKYDIRYMHVDVAAFATFGAMKVKSGSKSETLIHLRRRGE